MALSQVLAPQLQQSLALLQAPTLELKALIEQEMQQKMMQYMPVVLSVMFYRLPSGLMPMMGLEASILPSALC